MTMTKSKTEHFNYEMGIRGGGSPRNVADTCICGECPQCRRESRELDRLIYPNKTLYDRKVDPQERTEATALSDAERQKRYRDRQREARLATEGPRETSAEKWARIHAARFIKDGRPFNPLLMENEHGTRKGYRQYLCKCRKCTAWSSAQVAAQRAAKAGTMTA